MTIQKETVSRVLLSLRERHKPPGSTEPLAQEKAAARAGIAGRTWQRWEAQEVVPYLRNLEAVATAFDIPVTEFLDIDDQDGAPAALLSLEEVREEFRELVQGVNAKLDLVLSLLGEQALEEGARELAEIDPAEAEALAALAAARAGKGLKHPAA